MNTYAFDAQKAYEKAQAITAEVMANCDVAADAHARQTETVAFELASDIKLFLEDFEAKARHTAQLCERIADNIAKNQMGASINGLGELQQQSLYVDLMCARFQEIKAQLIVFDKLSK